MSYQKSSHDIGILRQDGTTKVGLMLAQKNGVPLYEVNGEEFLSPQQFTGTPGYAAVPPEKELPIQQDDWRSGFGLEIFDSTDPKRFFKSKNVDTRFRGMAIAGPKATALTNPPAITNRGFETGDFTGWTLNAGSAGSIISSNVYSGKYIASLLVSSSYRQDLANYAALASTTVTFKAWVLSTTASCARIGIDDGVSAMAYSSYHTGGGAYEQLTASLAFDASPTRCRIMLDSSATAGLKYFDACLVNDGGEIDTPTCRADFNSELYVGFGKTLAKLNATGDTFTHVKQFSAKISSLKAHADGFLYIGLDSDDEVIEDCEDAWNELVDADVTATLDTGDYKVGSGSVKFVCADLLAAGDIIATEAIAPSTGSRWSMFSGVKFWIKCSVALSANDLQLLLDDTAQCASPLETLQIPAITANEWTRVYQRFATPATVVSIISVGLKQNIDKGAMTVWLDDIRAEDSYWQMDTGENFTQSTLDTARHNSFAKWFEGVGDTMWKLLPPNNMYSATDPSNTGTWSGVTTIDSRNIAVTDLLTDGTSLYIMKEDRPFYIDSAGAVQVLVEDTKMLKSSTSGKNSLSWLGKIYMPWGDSALLEYDSGSNTWLSPSLFGSNIEEYDGQIQALAADEMWLFAFIDNSTYVELMAGRYETIDSVTSWIWHPLSELTLTGAEFAFVSPIYKKRLYVASTSSSDSFYYYSLPTGYGDVTTDSNRSFQTDGELQTCKLHANFKGDDKSYIKLTLRLEDTSANVYYEAHYKKLGDAAWTDIGDFKTSPVTSAFIPVDASSNKPTSHMIEFKFVPKTNATTSTPKLLGFDCRAILYPSRRRIINTLVRCCDDVVLKDGTIEKGNAANIKTVLEEAEDATWPITIYDIDGATKTVRFMPVRAKVTATEKNRVKERHYLLAMQEVTLS